MNDFGDPVVQMSFLSALLPKFYILFLLPVPLRWKS